MKSRKRGSGNQELQFASEHFKKKVSKKINAYHIFIQLGFIAQGLMQYLLIHCAKTVWGNFGTWLRTIRKNTLPSEKVVAMSMTRTYFEFLKDDSICAIFKKFLRNRTGIHQQQPFREAIKDAA